MYISDNLAREIYDRLVRTLSEEEVNRNRAREQRNVPAERYHQRQLLRIERSLQAFTEQMEEQKVPPAVNHLANTSNPTQAALAKALQANLPLQGARPNLYGLTSN